MYYATQFEIDRAAQRVIDGQPVANPRLVAAAMESLQNKVADQAERIAELEEELHRIPLVSWREPTTTETL